MPSFSMPKTQRSYYHPHLDSAGALEEMTNRDAQMIRDSDLEFDAIYVSGLSGIIPGAIVANKLGKQLIIARKPDTNSHATMIVEGMPTCKFTYIVYDDFVCSGSTLKRMAKQMNVTDDLGYSKCVGVFLNASGRRYQNPGFSNKRIHYFSTNHKTKQETGCQEKSSKQSDSNLLLENERGTFLSAATDTLELQNQLRLAIGLSKVKTTKALSNASRRSAISASQEAFNLRQALMRLKRPNPVSLAKSMMHSERPSLIEKEFNKPLTKLFVPPVCTFTSLSEILPNQPRLNSKCLTPTHLSNLMAGLTGKPQNRKLIVLSDYWPKQRGLSPLTGLMRPITRPDFQNIYQNVPVKATHLFRVATEYWESSLRRVNKKPSESEDRQQMNRCIQNLPKLRVATEGIGLWG